MRWMLRSEKPFSSSRSLCRSRARRGMTTVPRPSCCWRQSITWPMRQYSRIILAFTAIQAHAQAWAWRMRRLISTSNCAYCGGGGVTAAVVLLLFTLRSLHRRRPGGLPVNGGGHPGVGAGLESVAAAFAVTGPKLDARTSLVRHQGAVKELPLSRRFAFCRRGRRRSIRSGD